jgi:hypothetical protein
MGGQKGIAFFNRYLSREIDLTCITIKANTETNMEAYPINAILSNSKLRYINPIYFFTLRRIIRKSNITHLIIEHPYYGWLGILLKWYCKIKLIVHSHNIESMRFKSIGKWWWGILWHYEKTTHQMADHSFFIQDNDRNYATEKFRLHPQHCTTITYGFEFSSVPAAEDKRAAREHICLTHGIPLTDTLLLFNGTLGYKPNMDAVDAILTAINPLLLANRNFKYRILICGNKLPAAYNGLIEYKEKNIIYAGFVKDINVYFKGADIFINPVTGGGGINTKLVEALGYDLSVVSTASGAIGIPPEITRSKMKTVQDMDWEEFARQVIAMNTGTTIPDDFFKHFYWANIAARAAAVLHKLDHKN